AGSGCEVLQKLNTWTLRRSKARDAQVSPEYVVEVFLLGPIVLTRSHDLQAQYVPIKMQTRRGVGYDNRCVIDTQKQSAAGLMPFRQPLAGRKREYFQVMSVRITEIERLNTSRVGIPIWKPLRTTRGVLHVEASQT